MILTVNPAEAVHLLETVYRNPMPDPMGQDVLLSKIKSLLVDSLEEAEEKKTIEKYGEWAEKELEKINRLQEKNLEFQPQQARKVVSRKRK